MFLTHLHLSYSTPRYETFLLRHNDGYKLWIICANQLFHIAVFLFSTKLLIFIQLLFVLCGIMRKLIDNCYFYVINEYKVTMNLSHIVCNVLASPFRMLGSEQQCHSLEIPSVEKNLHSRLARSFPFGTIGETDQIDNIPI